MHELSIAQAILNLVCDHAPRGSLVRRVGVRVGPLQALEPSAMELAWTAATLDGPHPRAVLEIEYLPWTVRCNACGRRWSTEDPLATCACGSEDCAASGSAELTLLWLDVDEPETIVPLPTDDHSDPLRPPLRTPERRHADARIEKQSNLEEAG